MREVSWHISSMTTLNYENISKFNAQIMDGSTGNSKNVPKKSISFGRIMGFRQYTVGPRCEPKSLQPACTKFSNFVPILDMSIVTTRTFITSIGI